MIKYAQNDKQSSKVPFRGFRGDKRVAKLPSGIPLGALRYE